MENYNIEDIELTNGILKFKSKNHLKNVIDELVAKDNFTQFVQGFESLYDRQQSITSEEYDQIGESGNFGELSDVLYLREENEDKVITKIVDDARLAAVLNNKNYLIVADTAYYIGLDKVNYINIANNNDLLLEFIKNPHMDGSLSQPHIREFNQNSVTNGKVLDRTWEYTSPGLAKRRFVAEFVHHNAVVYQSLTVKVRHQKKQTIGWNSDPAPLIKFTATGHHWEAVYAAQFYFHGSRSAANVEEQSMFITEAYNLPIGWAVVAGWAECYGSQGNLSAPPFIEFGF